ncbi:MAG: hypothetical protein ABIN97_19960 [Ginsengibacter sp.]
MNNFCTLFDSNYLSKGMLMYESLIKHEPASHLYIFPFDDKAYQVLKNLNLSNATIIKMSDFENDKLLAVKITRTATEYCWTCTPSIIDYTLQTYQVTSCTYLDADLFFYNSPAVLINEMPSEYSVLITPHRYTPQYDQADTSGIYCVQFITFKNNMDSLKVLEWWRDACINWCYNKTEDGKFGDQKYLDDWPQRFEGIVWVLKNIGGGVAPWNVQQYRFSKTNKNKIDGIENSTGNAFELIFFHFHGLSFQKIKSSFYESQAIKFKTGYLLSDNCISVIYTPYIKQLLSKAHFIQKKFKVIIKNTSTVNIGLKQRLKISFKKRILNW